MSEPFVRQPTELQSTRHRILFVIPSLGGGGAERACINILRGLDQEWFECALCLFAKEGAFLSEVPPGLRSYDLRGRVQYDLRLIPRLSRIVRHERPSVVLSFLRYANAITVLAAAFSRPRPVIVLNEQNYPSAEMPRFRWLRFRRTAIRRLYAQADVITAISEGVASDLTTTFHVPHSRIAVIPNPVDVNRIRLLAQEPVDHPWFNGDAPVIIAVGRLEAQKGYPDLIEAFSILQRDVPARLVVLGEGSQREALEELAREKRLEDKVVFWGFQSNPYRFMARADVFALSSLYEGFGNVIVEALALGLPVVATDCQSGPAEILEGGRYGMLVPVGQPDAMAEALRCILLDSALRERLRREGPARAANFDLPVIVERYHHLLSGLLEARASKCAS
ncbi:MAG: glycosyltransferase [Chloroflexi bacterium]|nr:glycosyltransferase [Chloroflexota bacterium]